MVPARCPTTGTVPPPSYQRARKKQPVALHVTTLTLVTTHRLLDLCRQAVRLAHRRCPPPLPKSPSGRPRKSLLLIALLHTLWRLSYQDMHDWLHAWPALALAGGLPRDPAGHLQVPSQ